MGFTRVPLSGDKYFRELKPPLSSDILSSSWKPSNKRPSFLIPFHVSFSEKIVSIEKTQTGLLIFIDLIEESVFL
jgi:hypothetical protein